MPVYPLPMNEGYATRYPYGVIPGHRDLSGTADAISNAPGNPNYLVSGNWFIISTGVDNITLIAPNSGVQAATGTFPAQQGQDDFDLTFFDVGGHAHTITTPASAIAPAHHVLTFNGTVGSFVRIVARAGIWYIAGSTGVTAS